MSETWARWLALAVMRFGLSPDAFWRLSLSEWRALCAALDPVRPAPPDRAALEALLAAHPDTSTP